MVNPGHSSNGCATCKFRRVKCDETYPTCARCVKSHRLCLGYDARKRRNTALGAIRAEVIPQKEVAHYTQLNRIPRMDDQSLITLAVTTEVRSYMPGFFEVFDIAATEEGPGRAVLNVLDIVRATFNSLQEPVQTPKTRREQHTKYRLAMGELRHSLSLWPSSGMLFVPAFLFALYEMTVNLRADDRTWQIHLDGLLTLLRTPSTLTSNQTAATLVRAMKMLGSQKSTADLSFLSHTRNDFKKAWLFLDVAKLCLRMLSSEMDDLFSDTRRPRKLDVEKVRNSTRQVHRNLVLVPSMIPREAHPVRLSDASPGHSIEDSIGPTPGFLSSDPRESYPDISIALKWNEYRVLVIVTAILLLRSGEFLQSREDYKDAREYRDLSDTIQEAVDGICASVTYHLWGGTVDPVSPSHIIGVESNKTARALLLLWPLYCASKSPGIKSTQQRWLKNALWYIGEGSKIPKAMALAMDEEEGGSLSDILSGLLLIGVGLCKTGTAGGSF